MFRLIEGSLDDLIRAVESGCQELFRPRVEPGRIQVASVPAGARVAIDNAYQGVTPLISSTLLPGAHRVRVEADGRFPWASQVEVRAGQDLGINLTEANLPRRRRWPAYAAYGAGALGLAAAAAGGFLGVLSQVNPTGDTRESAQRDLSQKQRPGLRLDNGLHQRRGDGPPERRALPRLPGRHLRSPRALTVGGHRPAGGWCYGPPATVSWLSECRALDRRVWALAAARLVVTAGYSMVMPFLAMHLAVDRGCRRGHRGGDLAGRRAASGRCRNGWSGELADRIGRRSLMLGAMLDPGAEPGRRWAPPSPPGRPGR